MHFKLIIALVEDDKTDAVLDAARETGRGCRTDRRLDGTLSRPDRALDSI